MNRNILVFICLFLIKQELAFPPSSPTAVQLDRHEIYLPMKKDHKYGDDICYYREINEKLDYAVYYVKPCEQGKYCEDEISSDQPFGFCRDIETNVTNFPSYGDDCSSDGECPDNLICNNQCKWITSCDTTVQKTYNSFFCKPNVYKTFDAKFCEWYDFIFYETGAKNYRRSDTYYGTFPGYPKECGIIRYTTITDYETDSIPASSPISYRSYTRYVEQGKEWCSIGEAKDGDFVTNSYFCKSGFTLLFYPKGDLVDPSNNYYSEGLSEMCVTPTEIDVGNPLLAGCIITYKGADGSEHKYNVNRYYGALASTKCDKDLVIKSKIYQEFAEEFNSNASEDDKKNCFKIPRGPNNEGNCQNIKLLKLYYFYNNIKDYLFYKDRKDLEKVLHYKIQQNYHRYYELSTYLNLNYLFFFLILILL